MCFLTKKIVMVKLHIIFIKKKKLGILFFLLITLIHNIPIYGQITTNSIPEKGALDSIQSKNRTTSGVVTADAVEQQQGEKVLDVLQGRVAGVTTDGNGNIQVRGQNSFNSSHSTPLFIVDGVPLPSKFVINADESGQITSVNGINASNIERIEILKNADATSIYGSKGANGVVLIKTKKVLDNRLRVDADVSVGFSKINANRNLLNTEEYLDLRNKAFAADIANYDPKLTQTVSNAYDILLWGNNYHTNWNKELFGNTGKVYNGLLNVSGGTGQTLFSFSAGFYQTGTIYLAGIDDNLKRFNGGLTLQHTGFGNRLKIHANVLYSVLDIKNKGVSGSPESALTAAPNQPLYNENGGGIYWVPDNSSIANPLRNKYVDANNGQDLVLANFSIGYKIIEGLELKADLGYTKYFSDQFATYGEDYLNPYAANSYRNRTITTNSASELINIEPQLYYAADLGKGKFSALLGATFQAQNFSSNDYELRDYPNESVFRNAAAAAVKYSITAESNQHRYASAFGRVNYDYKNKYIVNAVFRRDGSSRFYKDNRFGNFWSLGTAWLFYREDFSKINFPFLSFGKLRLNYGTTGNDNVGDYKYIETYATSSYPYAGGTGLYSDQIVNTNFSWEITRKAELGLELSFLNDRLQVNTSLYDHRSNNLIAAFPVGSQSGFSAYSANMNEALILNQGIEVEILSTNVNRKDFSWNTSFNITIPKNKLVKYPDIEYTSFKDVYTVGKSLGITRLYKYTGINRENGAPTVEDVNKDGVITAADDKQFLNDQDPDYYGGFYNSLRYKNFQFEFFFQYTKRPYKESYLKTYYYPLGYLGKNTLRELATDYWTPENRDAKYPGLTTSSASDIGYAYIYQYTESDAVYSDASFIRLKNASLTYSLPSKVLKKLKVKSLKVYLRGQNLYTFAQFKGWDPETGNAIPPFTTFVAGAKISF
jgi:TonB-linked SusC/RagA family outer membrane protein